MKVKNYLDAMLDAYVSQTEQELSNIQKNSGRKVASEVIVKLLKKFLEENTVVADTSIPVSQVIMTFQKNYPDMKCMATDEVVLYALLCADIAVEAMMMKDGFTIELQIVVQGRRWKDNSAISKTREVKLKEKSATKCGNVKSKSKTIEGVDHKQGGLK